MMFLAVVVGMMVVVVGCLLWALRQREGARRWAVAAVMILGVMLGAPGLYYYYGAPAFADLAAGEQPSARALLSYARHRPDSAGQAYIGIAAMLSAAGQYATAAAYYGQARALVGDRPDLLAAQLDAALAAGAAAESLIAEALAVADEAPRIYWLAGFDAHRRGEVESAMAYFLQAKNKLPAGSDERKAVEEILKSYATENNNRQ